MKIVTLLTREVRRKSELSQEKFAERYHYCPRQVSNLENRRSLTELTHFLRMLADADNATWDALHVEVCKLRMLAPSTTGCNGDAKGNHDHETIISSPN